MPVGMGHDPDLVADVYADLVDVSALVEDPVEITTAEGEELEVTAVSRGDETLSPRMLQLRSQFSTWFQRQRETRYDLPAVDEQHQPDSFRRPQTEPRSDD